jgi:hypothetical protein
MASCECFCHNHMVLVYGNSKLNVINKTSILAWTGPRYKICNKQGYVAILYNFLSSHLWISGGSEVMCTAAKKAAQIRTRHLKSKISMEETLRAKRFLDLQTNRWLKMIYDFQVQLSLVLTFLTPLRYTYGNWAERV